jgi:hypothetical protein
MFSQLSVLFFLSTLGADVMKRILDMAGRLTETREFRDALGTKFMHKGRLRMPWDGLKYGGDVMLPAIKFDLNL